MSKSKCIGTLSIVATPIGNLGDWSYRAVEILKSVGLIACEDTRTSGVLLKHYGIGTKTIAYHEHNAEAARPTCGRQGCTCARSKAGRGKRAATSAGRQPGGLIHTRSLSAQLRACQLSCARAA